MMVQNEGRMKKRNLIAEKLSHKPAVPEQACEVRLETFCRSQSMRIRIFPFVNQVRISNQ